MKSFLKVSAVVETPTGIALLAVPAWLSAILVGAPLDTPAGLAMARVAGGALVALGLACWLGRSDAHNRQTTGIVAAMFLYNTAAAAIFFRLRFGLGLAGVGLLPIAGLHSLMALWSVICLKRRKP